MELLRLLEKKIKPKAERIDSDPQALFKAYKLLGREGLLAQNASQIDRETYFTFTELIQSYSGALGFFQRQHQAAGRFIFQSDNSRLKEEWLPLMARGKLRVGVSISHLRAPDAPSIVARQVKGGWSLRGHASWVSGYGLFDWLLMGFFSPEKGLEGMGLIRFKKGWGVRVSKSLATVALSSMQTVSIELKECFLPEERVVVWKAKGCYRASSNPLNVHFVNLSSVALGFLRELDDPTLRDGYEVCRERFLEEGADEALYAEMNRIATHLSYLARFSLGTKGALAPNSVERRCRELMLFSVILPAKKITEACLKLLIR